MANIHVGHNLPKFSKADTEAEPGRYSGGGLFSVSLKETLGHRYYHAPNRYNGNYLRILKLNLCIYFDQKLHSFLFWENV